MGVYVKLEEQQKPRTAKHNKYRTSQASFTTLGNKGGPAQQMSPMDFEAITSKVKVTMTFTVKWYPMSNQ